MEAGSTNRDKRPAQNVATTESRSQPTASTSTQPTDEGPDFYASLPPAALPPPLSEGQIPIESTIEEFARARLYEDQLRKADVVLQTKVTQKFFTLHNPKEERRDLESFALNKRTKRKVMSSRDKRRAGLFDIPDSVIKYRLFLPLHDLWTQYITDLIADAKGISELRNRLVKADYHGAYLKVVSSRCPTNVGIEGIVIMETANMFKLVTKSDSLKAIPKHKSVFVLRIMPDKLVTLYGDNLLIRSSERSAKKLKARMTIDIADV